MPIAEADLKRSSTGSHVVVFAFPFGTHAVPLLTLSRKLALSAPEVTFSFFNTAKSNNSVNGTKTEAVANLKVYDVADGVPEDYVLTGRPLEDIELFMKATPGNFKKGIELAIAETKGLEEKKISCIISDAFLWFSGEMADQMKVPWVSLWTAAPGSLSAHFYTDLIRHTIGDDVKTAMEEPLSFIPGMSKLRVGDLPDGIVFGRLESLFSCMLHRMGQMLPRAAAVVINSFEELDPTILDDLKSKFQKCLTVGPFTLTSPPPSDLDLNNCLSWLDGQKSASVAYVSFGTVMNPPPQEQAALADALEASGIPFLWSLKDRSKVHLPSGFLDRIKGRGIVVPWAPQSRVLAHSAVGVFVTHCGWNSVLESITGGVPMICRPFFGDQKVNGRMVEDMWGIGVGIEGGYFTKKGMMNGLELILSDEKGKKMREKLRSLKELVEKAVLPNGSSTENFKTLLEVVSICKSF
ncbi:hypothetical protein HHK36_013672 [Tetracentron sinense]|uniref:Glycosyltransferase n=1 Tax=Tetracentron sinense TaxID=13715 RepID=A0A834Z2H8_TETSI|nr:hypothetical protein HHK36_013672 [Tetracentron sinense]